MAKRILDEATKKQLLGYLPFSTSSKVSFTPKEFDAIENKDYVPVFELRSMTQGELLQLNVNSSNYTKANTPEETRRILDSNVSLVRGCVVGWSNLFDTGTGEEIEFIASSNGSCDDSVFQTLPMWMKISIMSFVKKISGLTSSEDLSVK